MTWQLGLELFDESRDRTAEGVAVVMGDVRSGLVARRRVGATSSSRNSSLRSAMSRHQELA